MHPTGVHVHMLRKWLKNALGHTISNHFIDTTFLRANAAKLQLCWTHMCRYLLNMIQVSSY